MKTSRRSLLKGAAVIPAAAAVATSGLGTAATEAAALPVPPTPYTEYPWRWFVSHDKEVYHDDFDTLEDALRYAQSSEYAYVAECRQQDFDLSLDGWQAIDYLNDQNGDRIGEGEGIECTPEQERDLDKMLTAAVEAWVVKHKIKITAWSFAETRNLTEVPEPAIPRTEGP